MTCRGATVRGLSAALLVGMALLAAGCSGGGSGNGVASLGSSESSTTLGSAGNSGTPLTPAQLTAMTAWAQCVRHHGVPNFPDPPYQAGELNRLGYRKFSSQMITANKACHAQALAAGVVQTQAELQHHLQQMLQIARCMRAHGFKDFPDPNSQGALVESTNQSNEPGYAAAAKACNAPPG